VTDGTILTLWRFLSLSLAFKASEKQSSQHAQLSISHLPVEILEPAISILLVVLQLAADVRGVMLRKYLYQQPGNIRHSFCLVAYVRCCKGVVKGDQNRMWQTDKIRFKKRSHSHQWSTRLISFGRRSDAKQHWQ
jgi:hypothetical protein